MAVQIRTGQVTDLAEFIRDTIGAAVVEGTGIDIAVSDAGDTITFAVTSVGATTAGELTTVIVPTVVTVAGTPELLFDADDNLVLMEVAYP